MGGEQKRKSSDFSGTRLIFVVAGFIPALWAGYKGIFNRL